MVLSKGKVPCDGCYCGQNIQVYPSDPAANEFYPMQALFAKLAEKIRSMVIEADISGVMEAVDELLDTSIPTEGYVIRQPLEPSDTEHLVDLSRIDFEALKVRFEKSRKRIETEKLRSAINLKLVQLVRLNKGRMDYLEKFQTMIDEGCCEADYRGDPGQAAEELYT